MELKKMRDMTGAELNTELSKMKKELFNLRFQHATGQLENPIQMRELKRDIARVKTKMCIRDRALHERRIVEIADMITKNKKRIILIAGPSSSGKTTFAQRLCIQLRVNGLVPLYMGTDDYFVEREDTPLDEYGEKNFEDLEAVDIGLFNSNMNDLLAGKTVDLPSFDFITGHKQFGKRFTSIKSNQPIVIEGIHALNEALTPDIPKEEKFKIYISPLTQLNIDSHNRIVTTDHRMLRRMVRDLKHRGHSAQSTIASWPKVCLLYTSKEVFAHRQELSAVGLDLPPITQLTEALRQRGMDIPDTILSVDEAAEEIAKALGRKRNAQ